MPNVNREKDPYLTEGFWNLPENQYWNRNNYTDKSKKELDAWVKKKKRTTKVKDIHQKL